jgi:hypothetical protein
MKEITVWWTAYGERTLEGAEAILFAETLLNLVDQIKINQFNDYNIGIQIFDELTFEQRISVLSIVGTGLLRVDVPCVKLMEVAEGAIASVFEHLINLIAVEIDGPAFDSDWREKVIAARKTTATEHVLASTCEDLEEWIDEVEALTERILWDIVYDDDYIYLNHSPEDSIWLKNIEGMSDSYYLEALEDLSRKDLDRKIIELRELCLSIVEAS